MNGFLLSLSLLGIFVGGGLVGFAIGRHQYAGRPVKLKEFGDAEHFKILPLQTDVYLVRKIDDGQAGARFIELPQETHWQPGQEFRVDKGPDYCHATLIR